MTRHRRWRERVLLRRCRPRCGCSGGGIGVVAFEEAVEGGAAVGAEEESDVVFFLHVIVFVFHKVFWMQREEVELSLLFVLMLHSFGLVLLFLMREICRQLETETAELAFSRYTTSRLCD